MQTGVALGVGTLPGAPGALPPMCVCCCLPVPLLICSPLRLTLPTPKLESRGRPLAPHGLQLQETAWAVGVRQHVR